jgi:AAA+ ATPase superfamily predicted ATPase
MIGRKDEITELQQIVESNQPEFLVVFGRRRVGKTFLVREFF